MILLNEMKNLIILAAMVFGLFACAPNNAKKPITALMLNGISRTINAKTPPIALIGIAVKINAACFKDLNVK